MLAVAGAGYDTRGAKPGGLAIAPSLDLQHFPRRPDDTNELTDEVGIS